MRRKRGVAAALILAVSIMAAGVNPQRVWSMDFTRQSDGNFVTEEDADGFYYQATEKQLEEGTCTLLVYGGNHADLVLPKNCGSYKVIGIDKSFCSIIPYLENGMQSLATVKIPSGYRSIESGDGGKSGAFQNQTALYRIEIPESVTKIGDKAFEGCDYSRLTFVTPYGSFAEEYAIAHGIQYSNSKKLQIVPNGTLMFAGEKKTIAVYNNGSAVKWKSSDTAVATVNSQGTVTAKKAGTAKITATIGMKTYSYKFTVRTRTEENVLAVIWANYVTPGMSDYEKAMAAAEWMKANVKVTGNANTSKTALEKGKASATGYAKAYQKILSHYGLTVKLFVDGGTMTNKVKIGSKTYTLSALAKSKTIDKTYTTTNVEAVALKQSRLTLKIGEKGSYGAGGTKKTIKWSSSNKDVATVNKSGTVTAKGAGTAKITMTVGKKSYVCTVRVKK